MKLPDIPTDNLYKFLAISGIIIYLMTYLPLFHTYKLKLQLARLQGESETFNKERDRLVSDANAASNELLNLSNQISEIQKNKKVTEGAAEILQKKLEEKIAKLSEYNQLLHKQTLKAIEINTKWKELGIHTEMLKWEMGLVWSGQLVGGGGCVGMVFSLV